MKMNIRSSMLLLAVVITVACGGSGNPAGPGASTAGVSLDGTVMGSVVAAASGRSAAAALTVSVEGTTLTTTVEGNTFSLRGLPQGSFTLVFSQGGTVIGRISFDGVAPNQQLTVTVEVTTAGVQLVEERRNGIGHGDLEIEGNVEEVLSLDPAGDSRLRIGGYTVVVRALQSTIRQGDRARSVEALVPGLHVHVKGSWLPAATGATQEVLALEVMIQGGRVDGPPSPGASPTPGPSGSPEPGNRAACAISGGRVGDGIQLEGSVASGSGAAFMMRVQGNRSSALVEINASGAQFDCQGGGPHTPSPGQCQQSVVAGAQVHVGGTLTACSATSASVRADSVRVQH